MLLATYCSLHTTHYLLLTTYYLLPTTHHPLPTTHYLQLTYYLLLTTYYYYYCLGRRAHVTLPLHYRHTPLHCLGRRAHVRVGAECAAGRARLRLRAPAVRPAPSAARPPRGARRRHQSQWCRPCLTLRHGVNCSGSAGGRALPGILSQVQSVYGSTLHSSSKSDVASPSAR